MARFRQRSAMPIPYRGVASRGARGPREGLSPPGLAPVALRKRAKEFRAQVRTGHPKFTQPVQELHPRLSEGRGPKAWSAFTLADAQLVIARMYGFPRWNQLREYAHRIAHYRRSPQRRPIGEGGPIDEFLRLAGLTHRVPWRALAGEEPDDPARPERARELVAAHPAVSSMVSGRFISERSERMLRLVAPATRVARSTHPRLRVHQAA